MYKKLFFMILTLCLLLCGCGADAEAPAEPVEKEFAAAGLHLTLTDAFAEKSHAAYTLYAESEKLLVLGLKEEYSLFENTDFSAQTSPEQYAALVWSANQLEGEVPLVDDGELLWFEYDNHVNGADYRYRAYVFKDNDGFWLLQFAAHADAFEALSETIRGYAGSVYFDKPFLSTLPEIQTD
jgi:hypothetical protein